MNETQIVSQLNEIFSDVFDQKITVNPNMSAKDVEGWDSLMHITLIVTIEKTFKIRFKASDVTSFKCVGDVIAKIQTILAS